MAHCNKMNFFNGTTAAIIIITIILPCFFFRCCCTIHFAYIHFPLIFYSRRPSAISFIFVPFCCFCHHCCCNAELMNVYIYMRFCIATNFIFICPSLCVCMVFGWPDSMASAMHERSMENRDISRHILSFTKKNASKE